MPLRTDYDEAALAEFRRRWNVTRIDVFGSAIRDDFREEDSDVDLVLTFVDEREVGLFDLCRMRSELRDIFERSVDVLTRGGLDAMENPLRQHEIRSSLELLDAA